MKWKSRRIATLKKDIFPVLDRLPKHFDPLAFPGLRTRRTHSATTQAQVRRTARSWII